MPEDASGGSSRTAIAAIAVVAVGLVAYGLLSREEEPPPAAPASPAAAPPEPAAPAEPAVAPEPQAPHPDPDPVADLAVEPGSRLEIALDELQAGEPVRLSLMLAEPSLTDEARPVRLISVETGRVELEGRLDAERRAATIEIEPGLLRPGQYMVEVDTTERTHFPVRRYVLVVR